MWTEHRFISFDKTPIYYQRLKAAQPVKAILVVMHGMGEHSGRYRHAAEYFAGLGIECALMDLRGWGRSGGVRESLESFSDYEKDLKALHEYLARSSAHLPVFLLGHSMGGLVGASYAAGNRLPRCRGLILTSPLFGIGIPINAFKHFLALAVSRVLPHYTQGNGVKPEMLTHDLEILRRYVEDPYIFHGVSVRLYAELVRQMARRSQIAAKIACSVLVLQAGQERVVSRESALSFYDELKIEDKELEIYEGMYHEILNEVERERVFSRIGAWILKRS